jgi:hypothetical protein
MKAIWKFYKKTENKEWFGGWKERAREGECDQSTLHTCIEISK